MRIINLLIISIFFFSACNTQNRNEEETEPDAPETSFQIEKIWETDTVLRTPESVYHDEGQNILFVSNINGQPLEKDGDGFISTMGPEGIMIDLKWVTGLNAPKGIAVFMDTLYVTDIDELVVIDIPNSSIKRKIPVEGASFLNDVAVTDFGRVYFTDSNTGKIHMYEDGVVSDWITEGLDRPNGLYIEDSRILLTSSGSSDLKIVDPKTAEFVDVTQGIGAGDGVEYTGYEGYYVTSDWSGEVFLIYPDFSKHSLLKTKDDEINSADIGMNTEEHIIYVPTFFDNRVVAYKLNQIEEETEEGFDDM
jgi:hypothetical protein